MSDTPKVVNRGPRWWRLRSTDEDDRRQREVEHLINSASSWIGEAMNAWSDDDYGKVAVLAPLAVEHLGKAVLWSANPVLVVPLSQEAEANLVKLAIAPSLDDSKLRTVGLKLLLSRVEALIGPLPLDKSRRNRMVEVRNGAMHVASSEASRHVLTDALILCNHFIEQLDLKSEEFYRSHRESVTGLVAQGRSETEHRVAQKRAAARRILTQLEERLGEALFLETTDRWQEEVAYALEDEDGRALYWACPECSSQGLIRGHLDVFRTVDPDVSLDLDSPGEWEILLSPTSFSCNVCRLALTGADELAAGGLPSREIPLWAKELGPNFDPAREAERLYG
ncbi:hypothetical protein [Aldersonia kunmingensis]|uniref:hypothetical protein n=1 Tax=Aldersonia kunmingensis TaxID=408066 RepID=UPI0012EDCB53|nr:hypothetical protein [Aldersonia kunmingensis]